jgi:predicted DNA-binding transcriptional regulator AlpA
MTTVVTLPKRHYIDRRADRLVEDGRGPPDDLLNTRQVADWLQVSEAWLEIGRSKGYGPKYLRLGHKRVRYRREDVLTWLKARTHQCVSEYRED